MMVDAISEHPREVGESRASRNVFIVSNLNCGALLADLASRTA